MDALLFSTLAVAIAEIGDKTQLLALMMAARFGRPAPIIAGILLATLANHAMAVAMGAWLGQMVDATVLRWILGGSFLAMAVWILVPDKLDDADARPSRFGPFLVTLVAFFLAEMGDKTQIATVALGARYDAPVLVVLGTTLGMMLVNVPAVLLGQAALKIVPLRWARLGAALLFGALGMATLLAPVTG